MSYLHENYGAPNLRKVIFVPPLPKPRNVTATAEERELLLRAAPEHVRCWLLLCSDLAIRSGTAAILGPQHYDRARGLLTFRTKYQATQVLPVTAELKGLLNRCTLPDLPFVAQLPRGTYGAGPRPLESLGRMSIQGLRTAYGELKREVGITRKLTPHDLRRTTVRRVYDSTRDLRIAQALLGHSDLSSTLWYLQGQQVEVGIEVLEAVKVEAELAKMNPSTETIQ